MSKVLKIVGVVASIGAALVTAGVSLGISASLLSGIGLASVVGASLLAPKPPKVDASRENIDRLRANLDPRTPRKTVIGTTAMATDIRDEEFTDNQGYLHRFIVVAAHKVHAIDEIWFDDEIAWSSTGGVQGEHVGYLQVAIRTEGSAANAINISSRMGSTRRYTGLAYVHLRYKLTGNTQKTESPYAQSITTRITIRGRGALLYDPRKDSTVPGGSGDHRADDQSTWTWDANACRNPALALLFYLLGYRINGQISVNKGIPANRIDLESFAIAANICDELVATESGGTEPRYRCDGLWSEGDPSETVISQLKATMNADLDDVNGKYRLFIFHNDLALPVIDFDDSDVLEEFQWERGPSLDQTYNIFRGGYTDASDESLYQLVDYPPLEEPSLDGINRADQVDLPLVQSVTQAQRLIALRKGRQDHGGGTFTADFGPRAWGCEKNSVVRLTFAPRGFVTKLFRVASMEYRDDGTVPLVLREENAAIYAAPTLQARIPVVGNSGYDFTKNPLRRALLETDQNAIATSSQSLVAISATDTSITIGDHDRVYYDGRVPVLGATLTKEDDGTTDLAPSTAYYLYYDDPSRAGGAVAWKATRQFFTAQFDPTTQPARHFGGYIRTDTTGGTGSSGGGSLPPGSGGGGGGGFTPYPQVDSQ